jgi:hypothetical protein
MSQSLQSAQQSLQQAGQQTAQGGQGGQKGQSGQGGQAGQQGESTEQEMGKEPGSQQSSSSQQSGSSKGQGSSQNASRSGGRGSSGPPMGYGGKVGAQQPLPGVKKDELVKGSVNDKGQKLTRTYMGTPDPTQDKAAYYSVVPERVKAAESSLNREDIPAGYKKQVRDYFDSIQLKP